MASKIGLINSVVHCLHLDDDTCMAQVFSIINVGLQGRCSTLWAHALLPKAMRIFIIMTNTSNKRILLEGFLLLSSVINREEVAGILLFDWKKKGLQYVGLKFLSSEMSKLDDEHNPESNSYFSRVLNLVGLMSQQKGGLMMDAQKDKICHIVCHVIKMHENSKYTKDCFPSMVILEELMNDGPEIVAQLSNDYELLSCVLKIIHLLSHTSYCYCISWIVMARLLVRTSEVDMDVSTLNWLASIFLENSTVFMADLKHYFMGNSSSIYPAHDIKIAKALYRISCIVQRWKQVGNTSDYVDADEKADILLVFCRQYIEMLWLSEPF